MAVARITIPNDGWTYVEHATVGLVFPDGSTCEALVEQVIDLGKRIGFVLALPDEVPQEYIDQLEGMDNWLTDLLARNPAEVT